MADELGKRIKKMSLDEVQVNTQNQIKKYKDLINHYKQAMNDLVSKNKVTKEELTKKSINIEDPNIEVERIFHIKAKRKARKKSSYNKLLPQSEPKIDNKDIDYSSELLSDANQEAHEVLYSHEKGELSNNDFTPRDILCDLPSPHKEPLYSHLDFDDYFYVPKEELSQRSDLLEVSAPIEQQTQFLYNTKTP